MMLRGCFAVAVALSILAAPHSAPAQVQVSPFGKAASAYNAKEYSQAESLLTELIEADSNDPRVYYFRGLARVAQGRSDEARPDFEEGARLEAAGASRVSISRALERVQGPARRMLEKHRSAAKRAASLTANSARRARTLYSMYSQARSAYFKGDLAKSQQLLDEVVKQGSQDPRVFYFRGLTQQALGRTAEAKADFDQAVTLEVHPNNRIDVDRALERVQGPARRQLEAQREEQLAIVRAAQRQRRREMIAQLAARQNNGGLIANSVLPRPGTGQPTTPTVATTSPTGTKPPTVGTTTPTTTTPPVTPVAPVRPAAAGPAIDLSYLPTNAAVLVRVNVRDIWQAPLVRQYSDEQPVKDALAQIKQVTGLGPADIVSVTAATTEVADEVLAGPAGIAQGTADDDLVVVIRTRLPFDTSFLQNLPMFESAAHNGNDYFKPTQETIDSGEDLPSIFRADPKLLVVAMEPALQKAIDQGADFTPRPEFDFLDTSKQLLIGYVPDDPDALTGMLPDPAQDSSGSPSLDKLITAAKGNVRGLSFAIGVDDNLELGFSFLCTDQAVSDELNTAFGSLLDEGKNILTLAKAGMPPQIGGLADSLLRSVRSSSRTGTFTFSARITQQTINRGIVAIEEMGAGMLMELAGASGSEDDFGAPEPIDPIDPPDATAQAQNLKVAGTAKFFHRFDVDTDEPLAQGVEVTIDITGVQAKNANAHGFTTVTSAKDENGADLKHDDRLFDENEVGYGTPGAVGPDGFAEIFRYNSTGDEGAPLEEGPIEDPNFVQHPADGCRVAFHLLPSAQAPTKVASAQGIVKLRMVDDATLITVDDAKSSLGKNLTNAELIKEGYTLKLEEVEEKFGDFTAKMWRLTWINAPKDPMVISSHHRGGGKGLQSPELLDADGEVVTRFYTEFDGTTFSWSLPDQEDVPVPAGAKIRFTINKVVNIVDVPFTLTDLAIEKADPLSDPTDIPEFGTGEPIEPPKATAQPQNLKVAATSKISSQVEFDFDTNKELPRAIDLLLDITGVQAKNASGFGFITLTSAKDENGTDLKLREQQNDPFGGSGFTEIDREDFFITHPDDGCRIAVKIEPPTKAPTKIASAEGIVKLRIVDDSSEINVDDAKSLLGKNVTSAELTQAGYNLKLEETEEKFGDITVKQWKLTWLNAPADEKIIEEHGQDGGKGLQAPELIDADGKVVYFFDGRNFSTGGARSQFAWSMAIQDDTPIPDGVKLRFRINKEVSIVDVPFKVMNVDIGKSDF